MKYDFCAKSANCSMSSHKNLWLTTFVFPACDDETLSVTGELPEELHPEENKAAQTISAAAFVFNFLIITIPHNR